MTESNSSIYKDPLIDQILVIRESVIDMVHPSWNSIRGDTTKVYKENKLTINGIRIDNEDVSDQLNKYKKSHTLTSHKQSLVLGEMTSTFILLPRENFV